MTMKLLTAALPFLLPGCLSSITVFAAMKHSVLWNIDYVIPLNYFYKEFVLILSVSLIVVL